MSSGKLKFAVPLVIAVAGFAVSTARAQDAAPAPAPPACARDIDAGAVKDIIKSSGSVDSKVQRVVDLAKGSVVASWSSITRPGDVEKTLADVAKELISKVPSPLPKDLEDPAAKSVANPLKDALNAACLAQGGDAAAMKAAARTAAQIPEEAAAAPAEKRAAIVDIKSSGDSYGVGDRLRFVTKTDGFFLLKDSAPTTPKIAPCGAKFRVTNVEESGENVIGYFYKLPADSSTRLSVRGHKCNSGALDANSSVELDSDYQVSADRLERAPAYASGWEFGVLVAPYKFHFSDDATTPSATVGGYFGFQFGSPSVSLTPVFSVGLGAVTETTPPAAVAEGEPEPTQGTLATLSAAAGVLFTIRKAGGFTVGLLVGSDWTGQKERYKYDGKLWAAVSVGMSITD